MQHVRQGWCTSFRKHLLVSVSIRYAIRFNILQTSKTLLISGLLTKNPDTVLGEPMTSVEKLPNVKVTVSSPFLRTYRYLILLRVWWGVSPAEGYCYTKPDTEAFGILLINKYLKLKHSPYSYVWIIILLFQKIIIIF